jgi:hypothetical protein
MGRKRAIICFETEERFESVTDAANAIGATWPLVSNALKRHGACRGFHFYYADEVKPDDSVFDRKVNKNSRPIICLETNERFESQAKAAKAVGVPRAAIYAALRGHTATKGLHFYFADEPKPDEEFFRNRNWTRVRCKETGVVYESIAQAARETGVSERDIQAAAKRHGTTKGLHFYYADEPEPDDLLPRKKGIRVRCVETGVVYKTITQAAKETGASQSGIRGAASGMAGGTSMTDSGWLHYRDLKSRCPTCKRPAHIAERDGDFYFVDDEYNPFVRHAPVKTTEAVFRFFANGYRREHGTEPEVTGNRKLSERDILSGMGAVPTKTDLGKR